MTGVPMAGALLAWFTTILFFGPAGRVPRGTIRRTRTGDVYLACYDRNPFREHEADRACRRIGSLSAQAAITAGDVTRMART